MKGDIQFLDDSIYELGGKDFKVSSMAAAIIDSFIGLDKKQEKAIREVSGDEALKDYRNYIAMVNSITRPQKIAVIADPVSQTITGATALQHDPIPMETFFDFAEMFANDNNYTVGRITKGSDAVAGIEMTMVPDVMDIVSLGQGEDFMTNGFALRWNLGTIELGHYYERLVCSNGMVEMSYRKQSSIHSFDEKAMRKLLSYPKCADSGFTSFSSNAYTAMETRASLAEMESVSRTLFTNGLDNELVESIVPYQADKHAYEIKGYEHIDNTRAKGSLSVWEIFNRMTYFASHNDIWENDDNRRIQLMRASVNFLNRKRDIKEYYDIF